MASFQRAFSDLVKTRQLCQEEDDMTTNFLDDNDAKDLLLDGISQSVKELQREHLHNEAFTIANENVQVQRLCQHIDQVFLCGLYRREQGYWRLVNKMTRQEALHLLDHLPNVKTSLGKGRAWLYLSLNENVLESYLRALPNYDELIAGMYSKESFMRDSERMFTLTTLITGLDFLTFELTVDMDHFDRYGLLPAATNCGSFSFNYTSSSVEATTTFRAVHMPVGERSDPLAAASGRSWDFRGLKGYLSKQADKLTGGGGGGAGGNGGAGGGASGNGSAGNAAGAGDVAAAIAEAGSPTVDDSKASHSLTSSLSSLKVMASRWTSSHESGLSRPDYKGIAAVIPDSPRSGLEGESTHSSSTADVSPDSSAGLSDASALVTAAEAVEADAGSSGPAAMTTAQRLLASASSIARKVHETNSSPTAQDVTTSSSMLPMDGTPPALPYSVQDDRRHASLEAQSQDTQQRPARSKSVGASDARVGAGGHADVATATAAAAPARGGYASASVDVPAAPVTWASSRRTVDAAAAADQQHADESELSQSVEGSFTSSGTFKTKPSRRLDFGAGYVGRVVPPSAGDSVDGVAEEEDDVEVIQLSKKTKKGKKKKKPHVAVIASPRRIAEEDERTSSTTGSTSSQKSIGSAEGATSGRFASRLLEQQRQHMLQSDVSAHSSKPTSPVAEATPTNETMPDSGRAAESIAANPATAVSTTTASATNTSTTGSVDSTTSPPAALAAAGLVRSGATPSARLQTTETMSRAAANTSDTHRAILSSSPLLPSKPAVDLAAAAVQAADSGKGTAAAAAASASWAGTGAGDEPRPTTPVPVRSIYDSFVTSSPNPQAKQDSAALQPVPVEQLVAEDDDVILSPKPAPRADTSSFSFPGYDEYDFATADRSTRSEDVLEKSSSDSVVEVKTSDPPAPRPANVLEERPTETVAMQTESADTAAAATHGESATTTSSSRAPVAENTTRPASTRSNLSGNSSHSRTSLSGESLVARTSSNSSPSVRSVSTSSELDSLSAGGARAYRSSSRGNPSPSLLRHVSRNTTPSMVTDEHGEQLAVVELGSGLLGASGGGNESDMLPSLQRTKEALLEERNYPIPERPSLSEAKADAHDLPVDHNLQLMLSLKIFKVSSNENLVKLMRVQTSAGRGKFKVTIAVISNFAFYIMSMDGSEGKYHRELCFPYRNFDHIEISLSWQTITLVCKNSDQQTLITANEPVTRYLVKSLIRAAQSSGAQAPRVDASDRERLQILEQHIEGLDSEDVADSEFTLVHQPDADFRVLRYSVVHWEQLDGKESQSLFATSTAVIMEGPIFYKQTMVGISYWTEAYAVLRNGTFFIYPREDAEEPTVFIQLWGTHCGGCRRLNVADRQNCFEVKSTTDSLTLSVVKEDDLMSWLQAICEVVAGTMGNTAQAQCVQCSLVVTPTKLYCYQEDFWGGPLFLLSACDVNEVTTVFVDEDVRTYCTVAFGLTFESGSWLLCFDCEYELGQFETALSTAWLDLFKIPLTFAPIGEGPARERARDAVALVESRFNRSDSVTRGRT